MAVLYGNDAFSILMLSIEKASSSFLKKVFIFQKICFKVKVLKTFKIFSDCHIDLSNWGLFWKSLVPFFRGTYTLSVGSKMKPLRKSACQCYEKNQFTFYRKTCWKEQPSIFTAYLMNRIFQTSALLILDNRMYNRT